MSQHFIATPLSKRYCGAKEMPKPSDEREYACLVQTPTLLDFFFHLRRNKKLPLPLKS